MTTEEYQKLLKKIDEIQIRFITLPSMRVDFKPTEIKHYDFLQKH